MLRRLVPLLLHARAVSGPVLMRCSQVSWRPLRCLHGTWREARRRRLPVLRVLPLLLRRLVVLHMLRLEWPQLLLRLPVVMVLQVARRLVQRRRVLVRLEG
jgi:hypothetical protein